MQLSAWLDAWCDRAWRPGQVSAQHIRLDLYWLIGLGLLLMGVGLGLRDPWSADEPRFALVARDMMLTGNWLIPMIGGDTYADKPPVFFWLIASVYALTRSLRVAFLMPSLLAGVASVGLVYDLGRRLWNREVGFTAALLLLGSVQFVWQGRQAQIDATVCFWIVLGLYGLLRHLLLGPSWRWYYLGCAAAGFGIITKGVGFLPLLVLIPYFLYRANTWSPRPLLLQPGQSAWRWAWGPLAMLAAVCVWFVPMMLASLTSPELAAYRDEILFKQTVKRYANSWIHVEPVWFFVVNVIPPLWLPASAFIAWGVPRWRAAWRARDLRIALLLSWIALVLLFFSFSTGKRGIYILPALPACCLALAPVVLQAWPRPGMRRVLLALAMFISGVSLLASAYAVWTPSVRGETLSRYGIDPVGPLLCIGLLSALLCALTRVRHAALAWFGTLLIVLSVIGLWINPAMNAIRSSAGFVQEVEAMTSDVAELGLVRYSEEHLLMSRRTTVNFGHSRWREWQQEADDAAAWLAGRPGRALLIDDSVRQRCFKQAVAKALQDGNGDAWYLVNSGVDTGCVQRGHASAALLYTPPILHRESAANVR